VGGCFSKVRAWGLPKSLSDHVPLLIDSGENVDRTKKKFRFERQWLEREDFKEIVKMLGQLNALL
jgi:hypothetical protein